MYAIESYAEREPIRGVTEKGNGLIFRCENKLRTLNDRPSLGNTAKKFLERENAFISLLGFIVARKENSLLFPRSYRVLYRILYV